MSVAGITYQLERVRCGNPRCTKCVDAPSHGPYWYAYWRDGARVRKRYIGKQLRGAGVAIAAE